MNPPVDTSGFQLAGVPHPEEDAQLAELEAEARDYVLTRPWSKPIGEMLLAFGVSRILALFLVRFDEPIRWEGGRGCRAMGDRRGPAARAFCD